MPKLNKPIDKPEFWKERIKTAQKDHYSVYVTGEADWKKINTRHDELLDLYIPQDAKVLDAGCGYGRWSHKFENYTGVDFSPDFIELAKKKYPGKTFLQADLKSLPFKDKEFEWAFCVSIKRMVEDNLGESEWEKMQKELLRVSEYLLVLEYEDPNEHYVLPHEE